MSIRIVVGFMLVLPAFTIISAPMSEAAAKSNNTNNNGVKSQHQELVERVAELEAIVDAQNVQLSLNNDRIAEIGELVGELATRVAESEGTTANAIAEVQVKVGGNAAAISSNTQLLTEFSERVKGVEAGLAKLWTAVIEHGQTLAAYIAAAAHNGVTIQTGDDAGVVPEVVAYMEIDQGLLTVGLAMPPELLSQVGAGGVEATIRQVGGRGAGFQIPEKVVMEKQGDFFGAIVPVSAGGSGPGFSPGLYRLDYGTPWSTGAGGPYVNYVQLHATSGVEPVSVKTKFDGTRASIIIEVSTDGTIDPEASLTFTMEPQGDASPTTGKLYTMKFAGETPKTWIFETTNIEFVNPDKVDGGTYKLKFDDDVVRTISVDIRYVL